MRCTEPGDVPSRESVLRHRSAGRVRCRPMPSPLPPSTRSALGYRHGRGDPTTQPRPASDMRPGHRGRPTARPPLLVDWDRRRSGRRRLGSRRRRARRAACPTRCSRLDRPPPAVPDVHPLVTELARRHRRRCGPGASGDLYHALLPTILAQRITSGEAVRQWRRLVPPSSASRAPGPYRGLLLPPAPERLAATPAWWFHPLGIEAKRARPLERGRPRSPTGCGTGPSSRRRAPPAKLALVRGRRPVDDRLGARAGAAATTTPSPSATTTCRTSSPGTSPASPAADDARMLALLEPYRGQRGRVVRLLVLGRSPGPGASDPDDESCPMHRW